MRFGDRRSSDNVEFREGGGGGFGFGGGGGRGGGMLLGLIFSRFGIFGVLAVVGIGWLVGGDPLGLLGGGVQQASNAPANRNAGQVCSSNPTYRFACQTLASTEDQWTPMFQAMGQTYRPPRMVFYSRGTNSGCGQADSRIGPFYCPADQGIYLDTTFFDELAQRFAAPGDFAQAYVIAHEVGHHIQTLLGVSDRIRRAQSGVSEARSNALQVRMELQADCLAGVWASREQGIMEPGDLEEGMRAAAAIGDDTLQGNNAAPESFTHGTAAQRQEALMRGYRGGTYAACEGFTQGI
ncbi:MAG TPA: neutral zinc metallopeptidase [Allosphingosinicella sp.]|nr:neutral zinc metallopeptidase [Allosphingosinicella sp.]